MKRCFIAACLFFSAGAFGHSQVNGIPASATSSFPGNGRFAPGMPSSVASPGQTGFFNAVRNRELFPSPEHDRLRRVIYSEPIPLFFPIPFVYVQSEPEIQDRAAEMQRLRPLNPLAPPPQKIIVEIRDTRPETKAAVAPAPEPRQVQVEEPAVDRRAPTVFIFLDGSRKELRDFAIMKGQLIDLADGRTRRFELKDLDRVATLKINGENGVDVHLPAPSSD